LLIARNRNQDLFGADGPEQVHRGRERGELVLNRDPRYLVRLRSRKPYIPAITVPGTGEMGKFLGAPKVE